jgi:hypothetical protein
MPGCIPKRLLELHALAAPAGGARERGIRAHVEACAGCRAALEEFRAFYRDAAAVPERSVTGGAAKLLSASGVVPPERLVPAGAPGLPRAAARALILKPLDRPRGRGQRYRLAAEGGAPQRFETVQRFANVDEDVMARVVRDNASRELMMFLVGTGGFGDRVLEIDGVEGNFIPDGEGRVHLPGLDEKALSGRNLRLKSPIASFDLEPFTGFKERIFLEGRFEVRSPEFDRIDLEVEEDSGRTYYRVRIMKLNERAGGGNVTVEVSQKGEPRRLSMARKGVAVFEDLDLEKTLKIRIY